MNDTAILNIKNLNVWYKPDTHSVKDVSLSIERNTITSIIGMKGCGKTSLLRSINRLHELYPNVTVAGEISFNGKNIFQMDAIQIRKKIGMIFQTPCPFPSLSIYQNVLAAYFINKIPLSKVEKDKIAEKYLEDVGLWEDVKNDLNEKPRILTKGQQQQLCVARTIAIKPEIILMDEPSFALDSTSIYKIENLIYRLKDNTTVLLATHNLSQAIRISDYTLFMDKGEAVEFGTTSELFWDPQHKRTENFINMQPL